MHSYAVDTNERTWAAFGLAVVAALLSVGANRLVDALHLSVPWYLGAPTPLGVFGVLLVAYEHLGWRVSTFARLSRVPDLRGTWSGAVKTHRNGTELELAVEVYIRQTWQRLSIELHTESSASSSTMGSLELATHAHRTLTYAYLNEPTPDSDPSMHAHRGTARLQLSADGAGLRGDYYSGRDRAATGNIVLYRRTRRIGDHKPGSKGLPIMETLIGT